MYEKEEIRRFLSIIANFIIIVFEVAAFGFMWYRNFTEKNHLYLWGNVAIIVMYIAFVFLFTKSFNGYKISYFRLVDLCLSHTFSILFGCVYSYLVACLIYRSYVSPMPIITMGVIELIFVNCWVIIYRILYAKLYPPRKIIIIYGNYPLDSFLNKLKKRHDRYEICKIRNFADGIEEIERDILNYEGVFLYDLPAEERNIVVKYCYKHNIRAYIVPKVSDIIVKSAEELHLVDTPIYLTRNLGLHVGQRILKRFFDILLSLIGLVISLPFMLVIAICIKIYDGGPVFYKQKRLTKDGKEFNIYKFRSMRVDAEKNGPVLATKRDDRITPVGKVIRNLHLDELPQFWNVLKGDMSMVGPRPERREIFEKYKSEIPDFEFRLKVKAGLTGYAQVYGKYNTLPIDKLKMDLTYIQDFSFWLDLKLLILTIRIAFQKETSEGVIEEEIRKKNNKEEKKEEIDNRGKIR